MLKSSRMVRDTDILHTERDDFQLRFPLPANVMAQNTLLSRSSTDA